MQHIARAVYISRHWSPACITWHFTIFVIGYYMLNAEHQLIQNGGALS